jgi:hypothetical protein
MNRIKKNVMARRRDSGDRATQPSSPTARRFHLGGPLARAMTIFLNAKRWSWITGTG